MKWIHGSAMEQRNKYERVELEGQKEGTTETNSHSHSWCLRLIRPGNSRLGPVQFDTHITNHYPGHNRCTNVPTLLLLVKCTYFMHANIIFLGGHILWPTFAPFIILLQIHLCQDSVTTITLNRKGHLLRLWINGILQMN